MKFLVKVFSTSEDDDMRQAVLDLDGGWVLEITRLAAALDDFLAAATMACPASITSWYHLEVGLAWDPLVLWNGTHVDNENAESALARGMELIDEAQTTRLPDDFAPVEDDVARNQCMWLCYHAQEHTVWFHTLSKHCRAEWETEGIRLDVLPEMLKLEVGQSLAVAPHQPI